MTIGKNISSRKPRLPKIGEGRFLTQDDCLRWFRDLFVGTLVNNLENVRSKTERIHDCVLRIKSRSLLKVLRDFTRIRRSEFNKCSGPVLAVSHLGNCSTLVEFLFHIRRTLRLSIL